MSNNNQTWQATDTRFQQIFTIILKNDTEGFMATTEKLQCLQTFAQYIQSIDSTTISTFWKSIRDFDTDGHTVNDN